MLALTLVVWSLFPLVWLLGQAGLVSLTVEQVGGLQGGGQGGRSRG
jgi:bacteriorhodopsin